MSVSLDVPDFVFDLRVIGEGFCGNECSIPLVTSALQDELHIRTGHIDQIVSVGG